MRTRRHRTGQRASSGRPSGSVARRLAAAALPFLLTTAMGLGLLLPNAVAGGATTTVLTVIPSSAVTNQGVTLIATVAVGGGAPMGTVAFETTGGALLAGCASRPVATYAVATCQTSFAASPSPQQLTAVFTPTAASGDVGSTSAPVALPVGKDPTSINLQVSPSNVVKIGSSVTYRTTVTPSYGGPAKPSGSVDFLDGAKPIKSCAKQPLKAARVTASATCTLTYRAAGKHKITAKYLADANFSSSTSSPARMVTVQRTTPPVFTTMSWAFFHAARYTTVLSLVVNGPPAGGRVTISCSGTQACPYGRHVINVPFAKPCKSTPSHRCKPTPAGTLDLASRFRGRHLQPGTRLVVQIIKHGFIGKDYLFAMRAGQGPNIQVSCLAQGSSRPGVGC